ncbi:hypothetical protein HELRODRAFT_102800, partial [Helobdella robusta]|uniref:Uncharacterized protein n=1 Tax=Helobdella robusta TaxID=6412 RepID=T1EDC0_HELRO
MDYSVSMYLRQTWKDPRMSLNASNDVKELRLGDSRYKEIWLPDTFLRNEKAANFHLVTVENRMLKLTPAGTLWYVTKITATLACPMNLEKFPMDTQVCPMLFESFGYTYETMYFRMLQHNESIAIDISRDLQLPQFFIKNSSVINCDQNYTTGLYPCLEFKFILKRDIGYFLIQVYVPSILIVILSWVSFWINVDASPARVSIGLLTVLTTTTMSSGARATLPRVSYIKAIDVWMIICLLFVFLSLIEYAVVNVTARRTVRPQPPPSFPKPPRRLPPIPANQTRDLESGLPVSPGQRKPKKALNCFKKHAGRSPRNTPKPQHDGKYQARQLDKIARKIFPITFILFNCIY